MPEQKFVVRHAKTDTLPAGERVIKQDRETQTDLSERAEFLRRNGLDLSTLASSPKPRAIQTAEGLGAETVTVRDFLDEIDANQFGMGYEDVVSMLQGGKLTEDYSKAGEELAENLTTMPEQVGVTHSDIIAILLENPHIKTTIMNVGQAALNGLEVPNLSVVQVSY